MKHHVCYQQGWNRKYTNNTFVVVAPIKKEEEEEVRIQLPALVTLPRLRQHKL